MFFRLSRCHQFVWHDQALRTKINPKKVNLAIRAGLANWNCTYRETIVKIIHFSVVAGKSQQGPRLLLSQTSAPKIHIRETSDERYSGVFKEWPIGQFRKNNAFWAPCPITPLQCLLTASLLWTWQPGQTPHFLNNFSSFKNSGSCHKRQKPQAPTPQAPIRNRQTRKIANAKGLNRKTNLT